MTWPELPPRRSQEDAARERQLWANVLKLTDVDSECRHGALAIDNPQPCGCWHAYRRRLFEAYGPYIFDNFPASPGGWRASPPPR